MKKIIFSIVFLILGLVSYSQSFSRDFKIDSRTLILGGDYILMSAPIGKYVEIDRMRIKYVPNGGTYTINTTDSILVKTDTPNSELDYLCYLSDSIFVKTVVFKGNAFIGGDYSTGNSITISIPSGKLTGGTGDLYIKLEGIIE